MTYGELISVVIPTYNRAGMLGRALRSVLAQDYPAFEVIVVDDASTDDTAATIRAMADPRVRLVVHARNGGAAAARNTGAAAARGALLAFNDSDDEWLDGKLSGVARALEALTAAHVGVYHGRIVYGRDPARRYGDRRVCCVPGPEVDGLSGDLAARLVAGNLIVPPVLLVRRAAFEAAGGFDPRLRNNEDWDFALRLARLGPIGYLDLPLSIAYSSDDSISKSGAKSARSYVRILAKLRRAGPAAPIPAVHYARAGALLVRSGRPRAGRRFLRAALAAGPGRAGVLARLAASWLPGAGRRGAATGG